MRAGLTTPVRMQTAIVALGAHGIVTTKKIAGVIVVSNQSELRKTYGYFKFRETKINDVCRVEYLRKRKYFLCSNITIYELEFSITRLKMEKRSPFCYQPPTERLHPILYPDISKFVFNHI